MRIVILGFMGLLLLVSAAIAQTEDPAVSRCDEEAAYPNDPSTSHKGIYFDRMDVASAQAACSEALEKFPNSPRIKFQLARALIAGGESHRARKLAEEAVADGFAFANVLLAYLATSGIDEPQDDERAFKLAFLAAEAGLPAAQAEVGVRFIQGTGIAKNVTEGLSWLERAVNGGSPRAQRVVAIEHLPSGGLETNVARALELLHQSADQDYAPAFLTLSYMYLYGEGVERDLLTGEKYVRRSYSLGNGDAAYLLAIFIDEGHDRGQSPR